MNDATEWIRGVADQFVPALRHLRLDATRADASGGSTTCGVLSGDSLPAGALQHRDAPPGQNQLHRPLLAS